MVMPLRLNLKVNMKCWSFGQKNLDVSSEFHHGGGHVLKFFDGPIGFSNMKFEKY
jgi:hypothetical protein